MARPQTYELLAGQEPFKGVIASGERSGGLNKLRAAVGNFLHGRGIDLDVPRRQALDAFTDTDKLTELFVDLGRVDDADGILKAVNDTLGYDGPQPDSPPPVSP